MPSLNFDSFLSDLRRTELEVASAQECCDTLKREISQNTQHLCQTIRSGYQKGQRQFGLFSSELIWSAILFNDIDQLAITSTKKLIDDVASLLDIIVAVRGEQIGSIGNQPVIRYLMEQRGRDFDPSRYEQPVYDWYVCRIDAVEPREGALTLMLKGVESFRIGTLPKAPTITRNLLNETNRELVFPVGLLHDKICIGEVPEDWHNGILDHFPTKAVDVSLHRLFDIARDLLLGHTSENSPNLKSTQQKEENHGVLLLAIETLGLTQLQYSKSPTEFKSAEVEARLGFELQKLTSEAARFRTEFPEILLFG